MKVNGTFSCKLFYLRTGMKQGVYWGGVVLQGGLKNKNYLSLRCIIKNNKTGNLMIRELQVIDYYLYNLKMKKL